MKLVLGTGPVGGRLEELIRRDGRSPWALSKAGDSALILGPIPDRQFRADAIEVLSQMLVAFDNDRADASLRDGMARVVTGVDTAVAERLVAVLGPLKSNAKVVSASSPSFASSNPARLLRGALMMGGGATLAAYLFVEPMTLAIIAVLGGLAGAVTAGRPQTKLALLDGTPRSAPDLPPELHELPELIAQSLAEMTESAASALEKIERFAFYLLGRLSDPADLLSVLGGTDSELGLSAVALAKAGLDTARKGNTNALKTAAMRVIDLRAALAATEQLTDGGEINAGIDSLVESLKNTVSVLKECTEQSS